MDTTVFESRPSGAGAGSAGDAADLASAYELVPALVKILQEKNFQEILRAVCEQACGILGADRSLVVQVLFRSPPERRIIHAHRHIASFLCSMEENPGKGFILDGAFDWDHVEVIQEPGRDPRIFKTEALIREGIRTLCVIPLKVKNRPFGVLFLYHLTRKSYSEKERAIASAFGKMASLSLEKGLLTGSLESRFNERLILERVLHLVNSSRNPDDVVRAVLDQGGPVMGTDRCTIMLADPETGEPQLFASRGISEQFVDRIGGLPNSFPIGRVYLSQPELHGPTIIRNVGEQPEFGPIHAEEGHKVLAAFPLRTEGKNVGALFYFWTEEEELDENRIALGKAFADQVALSLKNARQREKTEAYVQQLKILSSLSQKVSAAGSRREIYELLDRAGTDVLGADHCAVWLLREDGGFRCAWHRALSEGYLAVLENLPPAGNTGCTKAAADHQPVFVPDSRLDGATEAVRAAIARQGYRSSLHLPLYSGEETFGVIVYYFAQCRPISDELVSTSQTFVNHAAVAIKNIGLLEEVRQRADRLQLGDRIARAVGATLEPEELFRRIAREIRAVVPCDRLVIASLSPGSRRHHYLHVDSDVAVPPRLARDEDISDWFYREVYLPGAPCNVADFEVAGIAWADHLRGAGLRSMLTVPIMQASSCIAHMTLVSRERGAFDAAHEELLSSITSHLGPALRNAALFDESQRRASRLEVLNEVNQKITENLALAEVLDSIVEGVTSLLRADIAHLFLYEEETGEFVLSAGHSLVPDTMQKGFRISFGQGLVGQIGAKGEVAILPDVQEDERLLGKEWAREAGVHAYVSHPLLRQGKVIGIINAFSQESRFFTSEDLDFLASFASQAVVALQNASHYEESLSKGERLATLVDVARRLARETDLDYLLRDIAEAAAGFFGGEAGFRLREGDELVRAVTTPGAPQAMPSQKIRVGESISGRVVFSGVPIVTDDMTSDERVLPKNRKMDRPDRICAQMCVPVCLESRIIGTLNVYRERGHHFSESDLQLCMSLADQAAVAVDKARLFTETRQRASRLEVAGQIARVVGSALEPTDLLRTIVREIRRAIPCDRCVIGRIDPVGNHHAALFIDSDLPVEPYHPGYEVEHLWWYETAYGQKKAVNCPDLRKMANKRAEELVAAGFRSTLVVPILRDSEAIAHVFLSSQKICAFTKEHEELLVSISGHLAVALHNSSLYRTAEDRASRLETLNELSKKITANLSLSEVLDGITEAVVELLHAEQGVMFMADAKTSGLVLASAHGNWNVLDSLPVRLSEKMGLANWTLSHRKSLLVNDGPKDPRWLKAGWADSYGARSVVCQPILMGDEAIGVMMALSREAAYFKEDALGLLDSLAAQASIAIQNAKLHEDERRNREFFHSVVDDNADAIVVTDVAGNIILWNPAAESFFGHASEEVLGKPLARLIVPPDQWESWKKTVGENAKRLLHDGKAFTVEGTRMTKSGQRVPVSVTVSPVMEEGGGVHAISSIYKDLTDRMRADAERDLHIERLKSLNSLSQKIESSLDLDEVFDFTVHSAASMLAAPFVALYLLEDEMLRLRAYWGELHPSLNGHAFRYGEGGVGRVWQEGRPVHIRNVLADPEWVFREDAENFGIGSFLGMPLKVEGRTTGVISCLTRGERVFTPGEIELATAFANNVAVAIQNAEMYSRLENSFEELRRSKEMIVRAEKLSSLGVLAAGAAHEILNPANIIGLRAQRLFEWGEENSRLRETSDVIRRNVLRIARICDDLRRFSRKDPPRMKTFDLGGVIQESLDMMEPELRMAGVKVHFDPLSRSALVRGDSHQVQQVLMCLIENARDAMPEGGGLRVVCREAVFGGTKFWETRVHDMGEGIPEEILPRIFDPFFTTKPEDKGTGLGLSVSHGIIENHGGRIWAERNHPVGTVFTFTLPATEG